MKTILLSIILLCTLHANAQQYINLDAGYSTLKRLEFGVFYGIDIKQDYMVHPFAEIGARMHATLDVVPDFTSINAGITYHQGNIFASAKAGYAYCFNVLTKDVHKIDDTTVIIIHDGADKSWFFSPLMSAQLGMIIKDVPLYVDVTHAAKLTWFSIGVKITF